MVPAAPIMVDFLSFGFLPSLVCASKMTDNVHQDVSACAYFFFSLSLSLWVAFFTCGSPLFSFHLVSFVALRYFE